MIALFVQFADAGTNDTGAGWMTLVLPLALLAVVFAFWWRALKRRRRGGADTDPPSRR
jgi:threonine/homoserine/homoserine lactone efflux protein